MVFYFLITAVTIALAGLMDAVWTRTGQEGRRCWAVRRTSRRVRHPGMAGAPAASHHPAAACFRRAFPDAAPSTSCVSLLFS